MKVVFVYPPFCPPTVMPFSISSLKGFLKGTPIDAKCIDLNAKLHKMAFPAHYATIQGADVHKYSRFLRVLEKEARPMYSANNRKVVDGSKPDFAKEMLDLVLLEKPDVVAFSLVYSSQCFHAAVLIEELTKMGIACVAGGPAVAENIKELCTCLDNEVELVAHLAKLGNMPVPVLPKNAVPDFSDYDPSDYFAIEQIIPLKSSNTCYYKKCAFCTHFSLSPYKEIDLGTITEVIKTTGAKKFFFIDDMIPKRRIQKIAAALKPFDVTWWVQLKPTLDLIDVFPEAHDAGLRAICWGVESANQRVINLMDKGTKVEDISTVLQKSHEAGIRNAAYIMFGFPTETRQEATDTVSFLQTNKQYLSMVSTSVFGLQEGSKICKDPASFGVTNIIHHKRKFLDDRITYDVLSGLDMRSAKEFSREVQGAIRFLNKVPHAFKDYKEQMLVLPD